MDLENSTIDENEFNSLEFGNLSDDVTLIPIDSENWVSTSNYSNINESYNYDHTTEFNKILNKSTSNITNIFDLTQQSTILETLSEDICSCDLAYNSCDINCCCDKECSSEDVLAFTECYNTDLTLNKNYCFQKDIIYRNNTIYKVVKDERSSLFCIVYDNYKERLHFKNVPVLQFPQDFIILDHQNETTFSWDIFNIKHPPAKKIKKIGDPIYIKIQSIQVQWNLPSSCYSTVCSCRQNIGYLEDLNTSCFQSVENLQDECEKKYLFSLDTYVNFTLEQIIFSLDEENMKNYSTIIKPIIERNYSKPSYNKTTKTCFNIVKEISFLITHNGTKGIENIVVLYKVINVTDHKASFWQHFSVIFKWNNSTDNITLRSGNPGYKVGLPLLSGEIMNGTNRSSTIKIHVNGLTISKANGEGRCSNERKTVLFGKNYVSYCKIEKITTVCKDLQQRVFDALLEPTSKQTFVGIFGNANTSNVGEWLEVFHEGIGIDEDLSFSSDSCNIITGLKIEIAYAAVGSIINPQFKTIGVVFRYSSPEHIDISCISGSCTNFNLNAYIRISTSVSFFDVSQPAVSLHARMPTLKANLPHDFFYPFLLSRGATLFSTSQLYTILHVIFYINIQQLCI